MCKIKAARLRTKKRKATAEIQISVRRRNKEGQGGGYNFNVNALALKDFAVDADREGNVAFHMGGGAAPHGEVPVELGVADVFSGFIAADKLACFDNADFLYGAKVDKAVVHFRVRNRPPAAAVDLSVAENGEHISSGNAFAVVKGDGHGKAHVPEGSGAYGGKGGKIVRHLTGNSRQSFEMGYSVADYGVNSDIAKVGADMTVHIYGVVYSDLAVHKLVEVEKVLLLCADILYKVVAAAAGTYGEAGSGAAEGAVHHLIEGSVAAAGNEANLSAIRNGVFLAEANGVAGTFGKVHVHIFIPPREKLAYFPGNIVGHAALSRNGIYNKDIIHQKFPPNIYNAIHYSTKVIRYKDKINYFLGELYEKWANDILKTRLQPRGYSLVFRCYLGIGAVGDSTLVFPNFGATVCSGTKISIRCFND